MSTSAAIIFLISNHLLIESLRHSVFTALNCMKIRAGAVAQKIRKQRAQAAPQARLRSRVRRASAGGWHRDSKTSSSTPRVGHVTPMHRLVQGQHQETLPISGKLFFPPLGGRLG